MFAAAILGGIGKPMGAFAGGMVIGLAEELSAYPWLGDGPWCRRATRRRSPSSSWWLLLIFRPQGLFKGKV